MSRQPTHNQPATWSYRRTGMLTQQCLVAGNGAILHPGKAFVESLDPAAQNLESRR
jgi:hypothetical protein